MAIKREGKDYHHWWWEANLVAKSLSKTSYDDDGGANTDVFQDFITSVLAYRTSTNPDKRAIAVGGDVEIHKWDMSESPITGWNANIWMSMMWNRMFWDLFGGGSLGSNLYTGCLTASKYWMDKLADDTVNVTMPNDQNLYEYENFLMSQSVFDSYTTQYSVMDTQDLLDGVGAGTFNYVSVRFPNVFSLDYALLDAHYNLLAPNGVMTISECGDYGSLYQSYAEMHRNFFTDYMRRLTGYTDAHVYHLPVELGMVAVKKVG
jgi:hypothetical protein